MCPYCLVHSFPFRISLLHLSFIEDGRIGHNAISVTSGAFGRQFPLFLPLFNTLSKDKLKDKLKLPLFNPIDDSACYCASIVGVP